MKSFQKFRKLQEDIESLKYAGDDNSFALALMSEIDDQIGSIATEIERDSRPNKNSGTKLGISQLMLDKERTKYSALANEIIDKHPDLERANVGSARKGKDYAFKHVDMEKYVYVNVRPMGKRSSAGDDPNELMTAALCLLPKIKTPTNSDEMDELIETVRNSLGAVSGYKQGQVDSLTGDYPNLCQAVSAAITIHKAGYGNADKVYLTGQAWDDDVKQFQISKYGMSDFNSSDFIVRKGKNYLGVSLKKKPRTSTEDPTLINKAFSTLFKDKKFDKMIQALELKAGTFYLRVIARAKKMGALDAELVKDMKKKRPSTKNWKEYIQRIDNTIINAELKTGKSLFKGMADIIIKNKDMIANQLVQLIFKADLKELKKVNFDFTLVTGIGDYGPSKGVVIEKGEYKDIDTVTSKLDTLFSDGKVDIKLTPGKTQAFEPGAGAAMLFFDLMIGKIPVCNVSLRYKGNFRSAPSFLATMTPEFKKLYKEG